MDGPRTSSASCSWRRRVGGVVDHAPAYAVFVSGPLGEAHPDRWRYYVAAVLGWLRAPHRHRQAKAGELLMHTVFQIADGPEKTIRAGLGQLLHTDADGLERTQFK